uniref:Uncharacterized protein n=1 Tax=Anguilla anguilla TaxID=7936 RepID=A0A0E9WUY4_ANGAN
MTMKANQIVFLTYSTCFSCSPEPPLHYLVLNFLAATKSFNMLYVKTMAILFNVHFWQVI